MSEVLARRHQLRAVGTMFEHWKQYRLLKAVNGRRLQMGAVLDLLGLPLADLEGEEGDNSSAC